MKSEKLLGVYETAMLEAFETASRQGQPCSKEVTQVLSSITGFLATHHSNDERLIELLDKLRKTWNVYTK